MKKENKVIWDKIKKARKLEQEKEALLKDIFGMLSSEELEGVDLNASNSDNLEQTISCFIDYNEDEEKLFEYFLNRNKDTNKTDETDEIVYFELNNWFRDRDYPNDKPFLSWFEDDCNIPFMDKEWIKSNNLVVVMTIFNMSFNFCVTAKREWVENNCPQLLTLYKRFVRYPNKNGKVFGRFGCEFLPYTKENIGYHDLLRRV